jgi:hypothetical protein
MDGSASIGTDKFLIAIGAGLVLLVVLALVVIAARPELPYRQDDSAEAVVYNYLVALQQDDFRRAYSYLSPEMAGFPPDLSAFVQDVGDHEQAFRRGQEVTLHVEPAVVASDTDRVSAVVPVREMITSDDGIYAEGNPKHPFEMRLVLKEDGWKLVGGDRYWAATWNE